LILATQNAQNVYIATDKDFEGEKIAHSIVKHCHLEKYSRVVFTEITSNSILKAFQEPLDHLNQHYLDCQETRRIMDRLIGYKLSPILWKCFHSKTPISIGRVQSATLSIMMKKQKEIENFVPTKKWEIVGSFNLFENRELKYCHEKTIDLSRDHVEGVLSNIRNKWSLAASEIKESKTNPMKPLITSTLQQLAFQELKFPIKKTMTIAQKLYEKGFITYIRTDSAVLSHEFIQMASNFIETKYGKEYLNEDVKPVINKKNAQEAHEAIRPTSFVSEINLDIHHQRLYRLIWFRAIGYLMKPAIYQQMHIFISDESFQQGYHFLGNLEKLIFKGFLILDEKIKMDDTPIDDRIKKNKIKCHHVIGREKISEPPRYYNESAVVKMMESVGIGRPATYQITMDKLMDKGYIINKNIESVKKKIEIMTWKPSMPKTIARQEREIKYGGDKNKLVVSELGCAVYEFINNYFAFIGDINFSKDMEDQFDRLLTNETDKFTILHNFYRHLEPLLCQNFQAMRLNQEYKSISKKIKIMSGNYGYYILFKKKNIPLAPYLDIVKKEIHEIDIKDVKFLSSFPMIVEGNKIEYGRFGFYCRTNKNLDCLNLIKENFH
jgi:DNA topoisomerase-1